MEESHFENYENRKCVRTLWIIVCCSLHVHAFFFLCACRQPRKAQIQPQHDEALHTVFSPAPADVEVGQCLRCTDDVTPAELFLERGLKKAAIFYSPLPRVLVLFKAVHQRVLSSLSV